MSGLEDQFGRSDPGVLDFNLACAYRHEIYEQDCHKAQAKLNAYETARQIAPMLGIQVPAEEEDAYQPPADVHELIANDKYADGDTIIS